MVAISGTSRSWRSSRRIHAERKDSPTARRRVDAVKYTFFRHELRGLRARAVPVDLGTQSGLESRRERRPPASRRGARRQGRRPAGADVAAAWISADERYARAARVDRGDVSGRNAGARAGDQRRLRGEPRHVDAPGPAIGPARRDDAELHAGARPRPGAASRSPPVDAQRGRGEQTSRAGRPISMRCARW